jgi:hypothetical protein
MKTILAALGFIVAVAPSAAWAGKYSSKSKVTACSSYTYITGTTKTTCRTR